MPVELFRDGKQNKRQAVAHLLCKDRLFKDRKDLVLLMHSNGVRVEGIYLDYRRSLVCRESILFFLGLHKDSSCQRPYIYPITALSTRYCSSKLPCYLKGQSLTSGCANYRRPTGLSSESSPDKAIHLDLSDLHALDLLSYRIALT